jgi:hypothetical protein
MKNTRGALNQGTGNEQSSKTELSRKPLQANTITNNCAAPPPHQQRASAKPRLLFSPSCNKSPQPPKQSTVKEGSEGDQDFHPLTAKNKPSYSSWCQQTHVGTLSAVSLPADVMWERWNLPHPHTCSDETSSTSEVSGATGGPVTRLSCISQPGKCQGRHVGSQNSHSMQKS